MHGHGDRLRCDSRREGERAGRGSVVARSEGETPTPRDASSVPGVTPDVQTPGTRWVGADVGRQQEAIGPRGCGRWERGAAESRGTIRAGRQGGAREGRRVVGEGQGDVGHLGKPAYPRHEDDLLPQWSDEEEGEAPWERVSESGQPDRESGHRAGLRGHRDRGGIGSGRTPDGDGADGGVGRIGHAAHKGGTARRRIVHRDRLAVVRRCERNHKDGVADPRVSLGHAGRRDRERLRRSGGHAGHTPQNSDHTKCDKRGCPAGKDAHVISPCEGRWPEHTRPRDQEQRKTNQWSSWAGLLPGDKPATARLRGHSTWT